jgi:hypothetical protein
MYMTLERCGVLDSSYSQQVEFGLRPLSFFQARPFKRFERAADFEMPWGLVEGNSIPYLYDCTTFGITPSEGIQFRIKVINSLWADRLDTPEGDYGLMSCRNMKSTPSAGQRLGKLRGYFSAGDHLSWQQHCEYRYIKRADFAMLYDNYVRRLPYSSFSYNDPKDLAIFENSRLFSNGESAMLIPENYI